MRTNEGKRDKWTLGLCIKVQSPHCKSYHIIRNMENMQRAVRKERCVCSIWRALDMINFSLEVVNSRQLWSEERFMWFISPSDCSFAEKLEVSLGSLRSEEHKEIAGTKKLIKPWDCFHLSWGDRASARRAGMLYSSRSGINIFCGTSGIICSNLGFIKMEHNFVWINHTLLEMWGAEKKICLSPKKIEEEWSRKPTSMQPLKQWPLEGKDGHVLKLCI